VSAAGVPRGGDVVYVGPAASVQFGAGNGFCFRVIRAHDWSTYDGWALIDGYQLNANGEAVARRSIFVRPAGLRRVTPANGGQPGQRAPLRSARRTGTGTQRGSG